MKMKRSDAIRESRRVAKRRYGAVDLYPEQAAILRSVYDGRDTLGILPTSRGKSLTFQIPAVVTGKMTVVVTPLKALMRDQALRAKERGYEVVYTASDDTDDSEVEDALARGVDLFYVSAERLRNKSVLNAIRNAGRRPGLLAVDEAHVISDWGNRFRPAYAHLGRVVKRLGCPVLALTATATPAVLEEIVSSLGMKDPARIVADPVRANIAYETIAGRSTWSAVLDRLRWWTHERFPGRYLVYCQSRAAVESVAAKLNGVRPATAAPYHAGLPEQQRKTVETRFVRGDVRVVVCTNAFGMGIDVPDIREVVHFGIPKSPEAYVQEVGRGGRDGLPCRGVLLYDERSVSLVERLVRSGVPTEEHVGWVWGVLEEIAGEPNGVYEGSLFDLLDRVRRKYRVPEDKFSPYQLEPTLLTLDAAGAVTVQRSESSKDIVPDREAIADVLPTLKPKARRVAEALTRTTGPSIMLESFARVASGSLGLSETFVRRSIESLGQRNICGFQRNYNRLRVTVHKHGEPARDVVDFEALDARVERDVEKVGQMVRYASLATDDLRKAFFREYFGYRTPESK
jgi:RecQ family ATP-dependent DNA helicase